MSFFLYKIPGITKLNHIIYFQAQMQTNFNNTFKNECKTFNFYAELKEKTL